MVCFCIIYLGLVFVNFEFLDSQLFSEYLPFKLAKIDWKKTRIYFQYAYVINISDRILKISERIN